MENNRDGFLIRKIELCSSIERFVVGRGLISTQYCPLAGGIQNISNTVYIQTKIKVQ